MCFKSTLLCRVCAVLIFGRNIPGNIIFHLFISEIFTQRKINAAVNKEDNFFSEIAISKCQNSTHPVVQFHSHKNITICVLQLLSCRQFNLFLQFINSKLLREIKKYIFFYLIKNFYNYSKYFFFYYNFRGKFEFSHKKKAKWQSW